MSSPDTAAREEGRADRAMMALDAEADRWLAETPEFREAIRSIANCMRGPFKDRAAAQIDAIVRNTFIEAYYRGFNAHKDGAALRSTPDPAQGADRSGAGGAEGLEQAVAPVSLSKAQRRALRDIKQARPIAGNDDGWVMPGCSRPTLWALERRGLIERHGYDAQGVVNGAGECRLTDDGRAAAFTLGTELSEEDRR